jgi:hypothetical protein
MAAQKNYDSNIYSGRVVYIFAFDIAYDMKRDRISELLGNRLEEFSIGPSKRSPKQMFFYRPQMLKLPEQKLKIFGKDVNIQQTIKIFNIGAVSIQLTVPFEVERIGQLISYHDLNIGQFSIGQHVRMLAEDILHQLKPFCVRPVTQLSQPEEYTIFCFDGLPGRDDSSNFNAEKWFINNRRAVAALLTEEEKPDSLSEQEAMESTEQYFIYYQSDLVVVDWDAALIIGEEENLGDVLHVMEVANVQLMELEAYDRVLDSSLETAYRDLARTHTSPGREVLKNLREIRVDLARLNDELVNITKFFGDWHLARIYQSVSKRFHLADWHKIIGEKIRTLGELYQMLQENRFNFWMVMLEIAIVLLFVIDVLLLFFH